jgi:hypothetical protein
MLKARSSFSSARQASSDLTIATVPAGTSFLAVSREPSDVLMRYAAAFLHRPVKLSPVDPHAVQNDRELWKVRTRKHKNSAPQKSPDAKPGGSHQQPMHSGISDLASRLVFGNAAERPCAFGSPSVLQKLFHAVESQAFDKSRVGRLHRNDERPDWHQALRPNDGWSAYHRSDTTDKDAPAGKHRTT